MTIVDAVLRSLPKGIAAIQLRAKSLSGRALFDAAGALGETTRLYQAPLLINDRVDIALAAGADGVHLPASGLSPAEARLLDRNHLDVIDPALSLTLSATATATICSTRSTFVYAAAPATVMAEGRSFTSPSPSTTTTTTTTNYQTQSRQRDNGLAPNFLIGVSTHTLDEVLMAARQGADYVSFGPVFATPSKGAPTGLASLAQAVASVAIPVFALGGVGPSEALACTKVGARIACIRAVLGGDPERAVENARQFLTSIGTDS